jgi:hypothetical protein
MQDSAILQPGELQMRLALMTCVIAAVGLLPASIVRNRSRIIDDHAQRIVL